MHFLINVFDGELLSQPPTETLKLDAFSHVTPTTQWYAVVKI